MIFLDSEEQPPHLVQVDVRNGVSHPLGVLLPLLRLLRLHRVLVGRRVVAPA